MAGDEQDDGVGCGKTRRLKRLRRWREPEAEVPESEEEAEVIDLDSPLQPGMRLPMLRSVGFLVIGAGCAGCI